MMELCCFIVILHDITVYKYVYMSFIQLANSNHEVVSISLSVHVTAMLSYIIKEEEMTPRTVSFLCLFELS